MIHRGIDSLKEALMKEVKKREEKDPDQIDEVPVKPGHFHRVVILL